HQVAQKINMTRSPRKSDNFACSPSKVVTSKSGAIFLLSKPISSDSTTNSSEFEYVSSREREIRLLLDVILHLSPRSSYETIKSNTAQPSIPTIMTISIPFFTR